MSGGSLVEGPAETRLGGIRLRPTGKPEDKSLNPKPVRAAIIPDWRFISSCVGGEANSANKEY